MKASETAMSCMATRERSLPPSVIVTDMEGTVGSINSFACYLFGYPEAEVLRKSVAVMLPEWPEMQRTLRELPDADVTITRITSGLTRRGMLVKVQVSASRVLVATAEIVSLLIDVLVEQTFSVVVNEHHIILSVTGNCLETCGYAEAGLVGAHMSLLCPGYTESKGSAPSSGVLCPMLVAESFNLGSVKTRMSHRTGRTVMVDFCLQKLPDGLLSAAIREVESDMDAMVTVDNDEHISSVSSGCGKLFGYELTEMVGMHISAICINVAWKAGKHTFTCQHKNGTHFFVSVVIESFMEGGAEFYRGLVHRIQPNLESRKRSVVPYNDTIVDGGILGWYNVTEKVLGTGFFGSVKVATHRVSGVSVAIKTLKKQQFLDCGMQYPPREVRLVESLRHPNIFRFFHAITTSDAVYMILEKVSGGELFDYVAQHDGLDESECRIIMRQVFGAVD
jgi:PAS domain S-box-containing protein